MSGERPPKNAESDSAAATAAGIAGVEKAFLRLTFWQTLLSLVGVFVGAVALYAALNESRAVRQQTAAAVWPYLQIMIRDRETEQDAHFSLRFTNVGVGPARMQSMLVEVDGRAMVQWRQVLDLINPKKGEDAQNYGRSFITNRVIAPGEEVEVLSTTDRELVRGLRQGVYSGRANVTFCYCSIFEDCYLQETRSPTTRPVEVAHCPDYGDRQFME